jgi:hypothetical protein
MDGATRKGKCLCGAVRLELKGELDPSDACHCSQCRKMTGHYFASTNLPESALTVHGADKVSWYQSSEKAKRGFCSVCGSSLFWKEIGSDRIAVAMGALETPTDLKLAFHIFVADKGDYYEIGDGLPAYPGLP